MIEVLVDVDSGTFKVVCTMDRINDAMEIIKEIEK